MGSGGKSSAKTGLASGGVIAPAGAAQGSKVVRVSNLPDGSWKVEVEEA